MANFKYDGEIEDALKDAIEFQLPPLPVPLRTEEKPKYEEDMNNYNKRIFFKLYSLWVFWASLVENKDLSEMLARQAPQESDEYKAKSVLIDVIDYLGHFLGNTPIDKECAWLRIHDPTEESHSEQDTE